MTTIRGRRFPAWYHKKIVTAASLSIFVALFASRLLYFRRQPRHVKACTFSTFDADTGVMVADAKFSDE